jgi:hypothetical protein
MEIIGPHSLYGRAKQVRAREKRRERERERESASQDFFAFQSALFMVFSVQGAKHHGLRKRTQKARALAFFSSRLSDSRVQPQP